MTISSDTDPIGEKREVRPDSGSNGEPPTDRLFEALADRRRRQILRFLVDQPECTARDAELVDVVIDRAPESDRPGRRATEIDLHHCHLPKLESAGLIEREPVDGVVRYRQDDLLEDLLALPVTRERS